MRIKRCAERSRSLPTFKEPSNIGGLIFFKQSKTIITGTSSADAIGNSMKGATIDAGKGDDSIISNGTDNDYVSNTGASVNVDSGDGNDSLVGGKGADKLYGGAGSDTFIYVQGEGKDVISGFDSSDMLLITGTFSASCDASSKLVAFTIGDGSITLKDFSAKTFNVNGVSYRIKGNSFVRK